MSYVLVHCNSAIWLPLGMDSVTHNKLPVIRTILRFRMPTQPLNQESNSFGVKLIRQSIYTPSTLTALYEKM